MPKLDYDGEKFEIYVDYSRKNHALLSKNIGKCYKRRSKGCWSVPDNYWTLVKLNEYYDLEPTDEADARMQEYRDKFNYIFKELMPKLRKVKNLPAEEFNLKDFTPGGKYELYDHQKKMLWAASNFLKLDCGFAFLTDTGTGKSAATAATIEYLLQTGEIESCLIVTPAGLKYNMAQELETHSNVDYNLLVDYAKDQRKGKIGRRWRWTKSGVAIDRYIDGYTDYLDNETDAPIQIVNYNCVALETDRFRSYDLLVGDEWHKLRRRTSNRSKAFMKLSKDISKILGATATPVCKDYRDIWSQFQIIDDDLFPNRFQTFRDKIAYTFEMDIGNNRTKTEVSDWKPDGVEWMGKKINQRSIKYDLDECVDMPDLIDKEHVVSMPSELKKLYKELCDKMVLEFGSMGDPDYSYLDATNSLTVVTYERQLSSGVIKIDDEWRLLEDFKVQAAKDIINDEFNGEQCIIWYKHRGLLSILKEELEDYQVINGDASDVEKAKIIKGFNNEAFRFIIASVDCTEGWNAQDKCRYSIFLENPYTWEKKKQAIGRLYRNGQDNKVVYYDIVSKGSLDRRILRGLKEGKHLSEELLYETYFKKG